MRKVRRLRGEIGFPETVNGTLLGGSRTTIQTMSSVSGASFSSHSTVLQPFLTLLPLPPSSLFLRSSFPISHRLEVQWSHMGWIPELSMEALTCSVLQIWAIHPSLGSMVVLHSRYWYPDTQSTLALLQLRALELKIDQSQPPQQHGAVRTIMPRSQLPS